MARGPGGVARNSEFGIRNSESPPDSRFPEGPDRPCLIGLTGGLASGKSTVAGILARRGTPVLDADAVVHDLYRPGAAGARVVHEIFGPGVLDADGGVDRRLLGGRVLRDPGLRLALEGAIHPLVRREMARWITGLGDVPHAVIEAALLVETGSYRNYDVLIVVWCRREQQLERARARGVSDDRIEGLLDAQRSLDDKRDLADVVVDNTGRLADLGGETARAWREVEGRCETRNG